MSRNIRVSEPSPEMQIKIQRARRAITSQKMRMVKCPYVNAWGVVNGESNLDSFIMGFRIGANFAYEAFVSTETPFQDLLKE